MKTSVRRGIGFVLLLVTAGLTGCTSPMALKEKRSAAEIDDMTIAIFTVRTENSYHPSFHPKVTSAEIDEGGDDKIFIVDKIQGSGPHTGEFLISIDAEPGTHTLNDIAGSSFNGLIYGSFIWPIDATFTLQQNEITYIGHIDMDNRKRNDGEARSGSLFPLIDQSISGFSGGTFDVRISDRYDADIQLFVNAYPFIQGMPVYKSIMTQ
jgi:hypothetical protein